LLLSDDVSQLAPPPPPPEWPAIEAVKRIGGRVVRVRLRLRGRGVDKDDERVIGPAVDVIATLGVLRPSCASRPRGTRGLARARATLWRKRMMSAQAMTAPKRAMPRMAYSIRAACTENPCTVRLVTDAGNSFRL
jgi:hypothetical protein